MKAKDLPLVATYVVSALGLVALGVAVFFARRQSSDTRYVVGGRDLPWWALAASIARNEVSLVTLLALPLLVYPVQGNFTYLQLVLGALAGRLVISFFLVPHYFDGERLTVYELLEHRFGSAIRAAIAGLFVLLRTFADALRLLLAALAAGALLKGLDPGLSQVQATLWIVVSIGLLMLAVTLLGGIEAVVWVETLLMALSLVALAAATMALLAKVPGGFSAVMDLGETYRKLAVTDALDRGYVTFWAGLAGGGFLTLFTHGADQQMVQRYLCAGRTRSAVAALLSSGVLVLVQTAGMLFLGLVAFAVYAPYKIPSFGSAGARYLPFLQGDAILPHLLAHRLPPTVAVLLVASLLGLAVTSSLSAISAATVNDLLKPRMKPRADREWLSVARWVTLGAALAQLAIALYLRRKQVASLEKLLALSAVVNGPVLGLFLLHTFTVRAGRTGALAGLLAGAAAVAFLQVKGSVAWPWHVLIASLATAVVGGLVGWLFPRDGWEEESGA